MQCPRCGKELRPEDRRCPFCGYELTPAEQLPGREKLNEYKPGTMPPEVKEAVKTSRFLSFFAGCAKVLYYVLLFIGCQSVVMGGYLYALLAQTPSAATDPAVMASLSDQVMAKTVHLLLISNLITILFVCGMMRLRKKNPVTELELYPVNPFRFGTFALFGAAMNVCISVLIPMIPGAAELMEDHNSAFSFLLDDSVHPLLAVLSVAVVAGITEELIFRGIVISRLKSSVGMPLAVVLSALVFGIVHGSFIAVMYSAFIGLLLGILYARYSSILPGIIFHVFFNMTSLLMPEEPPVVLILVSAVLVPVCIWRIYFRYPVFHDIFTDVRDRIKPVNEEEAAIMAEIKSHQKKGMITADELEKLHDRWTENRKNCRRNKKYRK